VQTENRETKRFYPQGLTAHIIITPPLAAEVVINGLVVDMSYGGIKIRLEQPLAQIIEQAELKITLILPESGVPMSIRGTIRHVHNQSECGLQFDDRHTEFEMDDMLFECVKLAPQSMDDQAD
jgi:PilZ domain